MYRFYDSVDVCKIREGWAEARVNGCFPAFAGPPAKVALVNVFSTTDVDFCLFQEGVRLVFLCACKHIALYGLMVWLHAPCLLLYKKSASQQQYSSRHCKTLN